MTTVILTIIAAVCAVKWMIYRVSFMALTMYMLGKEYTPPADEELKACMEVVIRRSLGLKP